MGFSLFRNAINVSTTKAEETCLLINSVFPDQTCLYMQLTMGNVSERRKWKRDMLPSESEADLWSIGSRF